MVSALFLYVWYLMLCIYTCIIYMPLFFFFFLLDVDSGRRLSDVVRLPPLHGERLLYAHEAL